MERPSSIAVGNKRLSFPNFHQSSLADLTPHAYPICTSDLQQLSFDHSKRASGNASLLIDASSVRLAGLHSYYVGHDYQAEADEAQAIRQYDEVLAVPPPSSSI